MEKLTLHSYTKHAAHARNNVNSIALMCNRGDDDTCHVLPFFIPEVARVRVEYSDLSTPRTVIRGVVCVKNVVSSMFYILGPSEEHIEKVFYWTPVSEKGSCTFKRGLELVRSGLGFQKGRSKKGSLESFISKG